MSAKGPSSSSLSWPWPVPAGALAERLVVLTQVHDDLDLALVSAFRAIGARVAIFAAEKGGANIAVPVPDDTPIAVAGAFDAIEREAGAPIDILIAARHATGRSAAEQLSWGDWRGTLRYVLDGGFLHVSEFARRRLALGGGGSAVVLLDRSATSGAPGLAAVGAASAAFENLVRTWASEWSAEDIRVNALSVGLVQGRADLALRLAAERWSDAGESVPLGRLADPAEVASAALFLASPYSAYVVGATLAIDGGEGLRVSLGGPEFQSPRRTWLASSDPDMPPA